MGKGGSFDFREIEKLQERIEQLEREGDRFYRECINELAARLLAKVIKRTPVGKAPKLDGSKTVKAKVKGADGKTVTRAFLSKKGEILQKYWAGYQGGKLRRGWTIGNIQKVGGGYRIEVINPTSYASYVEYGHRQKPGRYIPALGKCAKRAWVPGVFMMTVSEQQLQSQAPAIIKKKLDDYLKGGLDV